MAMTNKMRRIVAQSRTPYMYLSSVRADGLCLIKFLKNKGKTGSPSRQHWFFNTPFSVPAECWDKELRCVKDTCENAVSINQQLAHLHDIAMMAIEEGNTQDQLRHLIDVQATKAHAIYATHTKVRTPAGPEETAQAPLFSSETSTVARAVEHINSLPTPDPLPELFGPGATKGQPEADEPASDQREFVVSGEVFTLEARAVRAAWDASKASGQPVEVFERKLVVIGRIDANGNA